jgi:hypothetical protein
MKPSLAGLMVSFGKLHKGSKSDDGGDEGDDEEHDPSDDMGGDDDDREMALSAADELLDAIEKKDREGVADAIEAIMRSCG